MLLLRLSSAVIRSLLSFYKYNTRTVCIAPGSLFARCFEMCFLANSGPLTPFIAIANGNSRPKATWPPDAEHGKARVPHDGANSPAPSRPGAYNKKRRAPSRMWYVNGLCREMRHLRLQIPPDSCHRGAGRNGTIRRRLRSYTITKALRCIRTPGAPANARPF